MSLKQLPTPALSIGGAGLYSADALSSVSKYLSASSRFGEPIPIIRTLDNGNFLVPRQVSRWGDNTKDLQSYGRKHLFKSKFKPRNSEQERIVSESVELLLAKDVNSFQIQAPTGFGKTICGIEIAARVGLWTLVVVPKEDVRDQWIESAEIVTGFLPGEVGLMQAKHVTAGPITIAMIQSLMKWDRYTYEFLSQFGLVIFDECDQVSADKFVHAAFQIPSYYRLGMTATPDRLDGKEIIFKAHVGPVRVKTTQISLVPKVLAIHTGWQIPYTYRQGVKAPIPHEPTRDAHVIKILANNKDRNKLLAHYAINAFLRGRKVILFSALLDHLHTLFVLLEKEGVQRSDMDFYVGGLSKTKREQVKKKRLLLATYKMAQRGTDIPDLDTALMCTPMANIEQLVGRILREYAGKKEPIVCDFIDSSSWLYEAYWRKRLKWYRSKGAKVVGRH